jgi:hypothetical protein
VTKYNKILWGWQLLRLSKPTAVFKIDSASIFRVLISEPDDGEGFIKRLDQPNDYEIPKKESVMFWVGSLTTICEQELL